MSGGSYDAGIRKAANSLVSSSTPPVTKHVLNVPSDAIGVWGNDQYGFGPHQFPLTFTYTVTRYCEYGTPETFPVT